MNGRFAVGTSLSFFTLSHFRFMVAAAAAFCMAGCGPRGPELVPVRGKVTVDGKATAGGKDLGGLDVVFLPERGTPGWGGRATTREDGSFELIAKIGGATKVRTGAIAGSYKVLVSEPEMEMVNDVPTFRPFDAPSRVPARYGGPDSSDLQVEVAKGMTDVVLDLKSK